MHRPDSVNGLSNFLAIPKMSARARPRLRTLPCFCSWYAGSAGRDPVSRAPRRVTQALQPPKALVRVPDTLVLVMRPVA